MGMTSCWAILGIAKTADHKTIRRAYAVLVKKNRPDTHPQDFMRLREAYEQALQYADNPFYWEEDEEENEDAETEEQTEENTSNPPEKKQETSPYSSHPWQSLVPDVVLINQPDSTPVLDLRFRGIDFDQTDEPESSSPQPELFTQMDFVSLIWQTDRVFLQQFAALSLAEQMQQQVEFMLFFHALIHDFSRYLINLSFSDVEELQHLLLTIFEENAYIDQLCFMSAAFKFNWATSLDAFNDAYRPDYSEQIACSLAFLLTRIEEKKFSMVFLDSMPKEFRPVYRKIRRLKAPFTAWTIFVWRRYCCRSQRRETLAAFLRITMNNAFLVQAIGEDVLAFLDARVDEYHLFIQDNKTFVKWFPLFVLVLGFFLFPIFVLFAVLLLLLWRRCDDFLASVFLFFSFHLNLLVRLMVRRLKNTAG